MCKPIYTGMAVYAVDDQTGNRIRLWGFGGCLTKWAMRKYNYRPRWQRLKLDWVIGPECFRPSRYKQGEAI